MKLGILYCGYNQHEFVEESIKPWIDLKNKDKNNVVIAACSLPFLEYRELDVKRDETQSYLVMLEKFKVIDKVFVEPEYIKETQARQLCLDYLLGESVDVIVLVDADEIYDDSQIEKVVKIIERDKFMVWYKLSFKNFFKNKDNYFDDPFCPARIFRVKVGSYKINRFTDDNDISYLYKDVEEIHSSRLPHFTVSKNHLWINHYSWLDNENSKNKVAYHAKHFSDGLCSYTWNEDGLSFNQDYYTRRGLSLPLVISQNKKT